MSATARAYATLAVAAGIAMMPAPGLAQQKGPAAQPSGEPSGLPQEFQQLAEILGRTGDWKAPEGVYSTPFPRSDLNVTIDGTPVPTSLGFGSWVAFKPVPGGVTVMSDMVLLSDEVNPVISALQAAGIEVTALHRHFQHEEPQIMYLHSHAFGDPAKIAEGYADALAKTATPKGQPTAPNPGGPGMDTAAIAKIIGQAGAASGGVYKITVGRDDLHVKVEGTEITKSMGLNSWAAFIGTGEAAHVAGDLAMLDREVNPVVRALRANGVEIVSIHNHMLGDEPRVYFLHYWGSGTAEKLARGFKAALDELGRR